LQFKKKSVKLSGNFIRYRIFSNRVPKKIVKLSEWENSILALFKNSPILRIGEIGAKIQFSYSESFTNI
jgi:hypothetical protein